MSLPEVILWGDLRRGGLRGLPFRRQHPMGPYILDFYCAPAKLAVEIDGAGHDNPVTASHDARRDGWLKAEGVQVLRFAAKDVLNDREREAVLWAITAAALGEEG